MKAFTVYLFIAAVVCGMACAETVTIGDMELFNLGRNIDVSAYANVEFTYVRTASVSSPRIRVAVAADDLSCLDLPQIAEDVVEYDGLGNIVVREIFSRSDAEESSSSRARPIQLLMSLVLGCAIWTHFKAGNAKSSFFVALVCVALYCAKGGLADSCFTEYSVIVTVEVPMDFESDSFQIHLHRGGNVNCNNLVTKSLEIRGCLSDFDCFVYLQNCSISDSLSICCRNSITVFNCDFSANCDIYLECVDGEVFYNCEPFEGYFDFTECDSVEGNFGGCNGITNGAKEGQCVPGNGKLVIICDKAIVTFRGGDEIPQTPSALLCPEDAVYKIKFLNLLLKTSIVTN